MKLPDMNVEYEDNREQPAAPVGRPRRAPADRKPKKSVVQAQQAAAVADLVRAARANGDCLTGPTGLLKQVTAMVLEAALEEEMTEHLGHAKHRGKRALQDEGVDEAAQQLDADSGSQERTRNVRNGSRTKTVLTDNAGKVDVTVPRDRAGTFEPVIVPKHHRKLGSVEELVLSLTSKGLTSGEISAHLSEIYGASVSKDTICRITDRVSEEMTEWFARPLDPIYAAIFIDAIVVKVKDGQVANRPFYAAIGVTVEGHKDILGLWAGTPGQVRAPSTGWRC